MVISDFASNVRRLLRLGRGRKKLTYTTKVVVGSDFASNVRDEYD